MPAIVAMPLGLLSAALIPGLTMAVLTLALLGKSGLGFALFYVYLGFFVAGAHVVVLGLPLALLGARLRKVSVLTSLLLGFLVGAAPTAVAYWPLFPSLGDLVQGSANVEGWHRVPLHIDGVLTPATWIAWARLAVLNGLLGAAGGLGFVFVWQRRRRRSE